MKMTRMLYTGQCLPDHNFVAYWRAPSYELQVSQRVRRRGLGKLLMQQLAIVGSKLGLEKVVLTVFKGTLAFPVNITSNSRFVMQPMQMLSSSINRWGMFQHAYVWRYLNLFLNRFSTDPNSPDYKDASDDVNDEAEAAADYEILSKELVPT